MPSKTDRQRKFMMAELGRRRAGQPTRTGMSEAQLREFVHTRGHGGAGGSPVRFRKREGGMGDR